MMRTLLLCFVTMSALLGITNAQFTYLDFEGTEPIHYTFGGSDFSIVDNPNKSGVNTSDKVAVTQKSGDGIETWGGAYFPLGGNINFNFSNQAYTMDVYSSAFGTATFKVERGAQGPVEILVEYTTPGEWQTLTFDMSSSATGALNADYKQIVIFMGFNSLAEDVWYYDNVKGPDITFGDVVEVTIKVMDLGGTITNAAVELSTDPGNKIDLFGIGGVGSDWTKGFSGATGSTIVAPVTYTIYVNGEIVPEMTDLPFATAGSGTSVLTANYGSTPLGYNLLNNGGFDEIEGDLVGRTGNLWGMWTGNGGVATVIDGVVKVTPVTSGDIWNMQVEQLEFKLENDITYTATFQAWADVDRIICLTIEDPANGYALFGTSEGEGAYDINGTTRSKWDIYITTEPAYYQRVMAVDQVKENSTFKFAFLLAQTADKVYIDNVSLVEGDVASVPAKKVIEGFFIYPNPVINYLYINSSNGLSKVAVYNLLGSMVKEYRNVSKKIDVSDLNSGIYLIKATSIKGQTITSKFIKK